MSTEFTTDKPIYLQILDYCMDCINMEKWSAESRIPSVKELSVTMAVNPRTVMRAYEELSTRGIIFQRRGMGFFVAADAREQVKTIRMKEFEETVLPEFIMKLRNADFPIGRVIEKLTEINT